LSTPAGGDAEAQQAAAQHSAPEDEWDDEAPEDGSDDEERDTGFTEIQEQNFDFDDFISRFKSLFLHFVNFKFNYSTLLD
jgi:hypothetical protein